MTFLDSREFAAGMTVDQLINALTIFRQRFGGDFVVLTTEYDTVGDIYMSDAICFLAYKDLRRFKLRPYMFEFSDEGLDG